MKVSLNWLKEFTDIDISVDELVRKIGSQLGAVEQVEDIGALYEGILAVKVVSCKAHPDADKLSVCLVDDGGKIQDVARDNEGRIQVVCGAPNVREGLMAAWLPPGSTVPNSIGKEPFVLESREIRGQISHGMLASAKELAISEEHDGIVEIELDCVPGDDFAKCYKLDDYIIDIENKMFTHRPDCFGVLGIAREVAGISGISFSSPDWYDFEISAQAPESSAQKLELVVINEIPEAVPRLCAVAVASVNIKSSSLMIQTMLSRVGIRPINNIVDMTNFLMVLTGQPLHAYDYDKLRQLGSEGEPPKLVARWPKENEVIELLNGKTLTVEEQTIIISSAGSAVALGGVMGGSTSEVDSNTKNIVLECANFDMYSTRRSSMRYGVFSDASTRFTKGQSPLQNIAVINRALQMTHEISGGVQASEVFDEGPEQHLAGHIDATVDFINQRLGLNLTSEEIKNLLTNVEFRVETSERGLDISAPFWRTDIVIAEDIVEETGRLYGYDKLPLQLPKKDLSPNSQEPMLQLKAQIRQLMSAAGANECLTYSFVNGTLMSRSGQNPEGSYHIRNALSPDLQYYRQSITPSLLDKVHPNIKNGFNRFAIFELGVAHHNSAASEDGLPDELPRFTTVIAASDKQSKSIAGAPFFAAKGYLLELAKSFGLNLKFIPLVDYQQNLSESWKAATGSYEPSRSAAVLLGSEVAGIIGEPKQATSQGLKLPNYCACFELDSSVLLANKLSYGSYKPLNRYPSSSQELTLSVEDSLAFEQLLEALNEELGQINGEHGYRSMLKTLDIFKSNNTAETKNLSFQLIMEHPERTLTNAEVSDVVEKLATYAAGKFGAHLV